MSDAAAGRVAAGFLGRDAGADGSRSRRAGAITACAICSTGKRAATAAICVVAGVRETGIRSLHEQTDAKGGSPRPGGKWKGSQKQKNGNVEKCMSHGGNFAGLPSVYASTRTQPHVRRLFSTTYTSESC